VLATACWTFPYYSQTFVYQELTQLARHGFTIRFLYSELDKSVPLPRQFRPVWRARRLLLLHSDVCDSSYAWFAARMPAKIDELVRRLSEASGLSEPEVRDHYHFKQSFAFARTVAAYGPDYLHSYFFYEGTLFTYVAAFLLDIPRGVSCYADHMLDDYVLKVVGLHLRQVRIAIATSARIKNELLGIEPKADPDRILVKPNGINTSAFPAVARKEPAGGEPFGLVSVCRIEPKKGLLYLVDAVGHLAERGVPVRAHILGGVDDSDASRNYHRDVEARINSLGLTDRVVLEGRRTEAEINARFNASHIFVAPFVETNTGDKDGIPTALLEGMASGLPVVATNAGSILEVIDDGLDGVIVPQADGAALADAIAALVGDTDRRSRLRENGVRKVKAKFDSATCERIFHTRLREVLSGHNATPR
jgi:glycosyltransferase involved in cell wall biosynthesis